MNNRYTELKQWFTAYTQTFKIGNKALDDAVLLKYDHTIRVCSEIEVLSETLCLGSHQCEIAKIAALFHDIARFEQFRIYGTFSDRKSRDHAEMAVEIINEHDIFSVIEPNDSHALLTAIRYHNAIAVPEELAPEHAFLCRLLRDADKLDIYKVALDYYNKPDPLRHETIQVGIPDGTEVSCEVCQHVIDRTIVPYEKISTVADFKMIQLGWVFDLNFTYSLLCVQQRGYIEDIKRHLPNTVLVCKAIKEVERYLEEKTGGSTAHVKK